VHPSVAGPAGGTDVTATTAPDEPDTTSSGRTPTPVVDAVVGASRALVAIAARSLGAAGEEVTLPQSRALVVLASRGPQRLVDLAGFLDVTASTATRMCDRLARKDLIRRQRLSSDRRSVRVSISPAGRDLVAAVTRRRRAEVQAIVDRMSPADREQLVATLLVFAEAAGEVPEQDWSLGWGPADD
jgi:DNA-binding MarR family transcriptional regulator